MKEKEVNTILGALAQHIEWLEAKIYVLERENEQLKKDKAALKESMDFLVNELSTSRLEEDEKNGIF